MTPAVSLPTLREVLGVGFCYKWRIVLAFLLPFTASVLIVLSLTPEYHADSKVLVRAGREYIPEIPGGMQTPQSTMQETIDTEAEILTGNDLLRHIVREAGVTRLYPSLPKRPPKDKPIEDAAIEKLRQDLVVAPVKLSNVIAISLRNPNRDVAVQTLGLVLSEFQERHMAAYSRNRTSVLTPELEADVAQLARLERERAAYQNEQGLFAIAEQRMALIQQKSHDVDALRTAEVERAKLNGQLVYLRSELAKQPETITLSSASQDSPLAQAAVRRAQELRVEKRRLMAEYPADSRLVAPTRQALQSAEEAAAQTKERSSIVTTGPNPLFTALQSKLYSSGTELAPLDSKIALLQQAVTVDDEKLAHVTSGETQLLAMNRAIDQLAAATSTLRQRLLDARVFEDLDRAGIASLNIIEQPSVSLRPVRSPPRAMVLGGGIVIGIASSTFVLLLSLTFGARFLTVETVERVLEVPVAATLSAISPRQLRRLAAPQGDPVTPARSPSTVL